MAADLRTRVMDAMKTVLDPEMRIDLVTAGMIKRCEVKGSDLDLEVELTTPACPLKDQIEREVRAALGKVSGLGGIALSFSARVRSAAPPGPVQGIPGVRNVIA